MNLISGFHLTNLISEADLANLISESLAAGPPPAAGVAEMQDIRELRKMI